MISKNLQILSLQSQISQVFLTGGQNNFGNKIPFIHICPVHYILSFNVQEKGFKHGILLPKLF